MSTSSTDRVVIIGAGTAGIATAARLARRDPSIRVTILDKSRKHYYQPGWTFVGAGVFSFLSTEKEVSEVLPTGATWVPVNAKEIRPEINTVVSEDGREFTYDYLVVAAGMQMNWDKIPGLKETLGRHGVCSNYTGGVNTWETIQAIRAGTAVFTTFSPIKCGGAPMKAMFLSWDFWKHQGLNMSKFDVLYATPSTSMFHVKKYSDILDKLCLSRQINRLYQHTLARVDGPRHLATFDTPEGPKVLHFTMLHVTPPMSAPDFLKGSPISNQDGFVDVHDVTLQHKRYPNIFALGDCSSLPTSKTAAAVCRQSPVLVHNLLQHRAGRKLNARYNGYTSCPLVTGYGSLLMMEFGYGQRVMEHLPWDQGIHDGWRGKLNYWIKKYVFPPTYWHGILKGRWYGPSGPFPSGSMIVN